MSNIDELIDRLRNNNIENNCHDCALGYYVFEAATALEELQAELQKSEHDNVNLTGELAKVAAELERVKRERDAAVEDVAAIIGDVEEIRRGYGVDNADADGAFAELCETYCANKGRSCYAECEKYHCKNFKWRGQKED